MSHIHINQATVIEAGHLFTTIRKGAQAVS